MSGVKKEKTAAEINLEYKANVLSALKAAGIPIGADNTVPAGIECEYLDGVGKYNIKKNDLNSLEKTYAEVYDVSFYQCRTVIYPDIIRLKYNGRTIYQNVDMIKEKQNNIENLDKFIKRWTREENERIERGKSVMEKENNKRGIDVLISVPSAYVKDVVRDDGKTFYKVKLPKDTVIDGYDFSYYQFAANKIYRNSDGTVSVPCPMDREVTLKSFDRESDGSWKLRDAQQVTGFAIANNMAKASNSNVVVLAKVSEAYVRREIPRHNGGTFCEVTVPRGTEIKGLDCSFYKFAVSSAYRNEAKFASIPLPVGRDVTLRKREKDEQSGEYKDLLPLKVNSLELVKAMEKSYDNYKAQMAEKENPFVEGEKAVAEPDKKVSEPEKVNEQKVMAEPEQPAKKQKERERSR